MLPSVLIFRDIEEASPELSTYLTCRLLLNLLGFVHDGLEVWSTEILKGLGHKVGKEKLRKYLEELKKTLLDIRPKLIVAKTLLETSRCIRNMAYHRSGVQNYGVTSNSCR